MNRIIAVIKPNMLDDVIFALHKIENLPVKKILPAHEDIFSDLQSYRQARHYCSYADRRFDIEAHTLYE